MADKSRTSSNASMDENNPFANDIPLPDNDDSATPPKRRHHRRLSSISKSHDDLENLEYAHFQNQCKTGSNATLSIIRLLTKLSEGYDRFARTMTSTVNLESNFVSKYTSKFNQDSTYLSTFQLLCSLTRDLAADFRDISVSIKAMTSPLMEFQRKCDAEYNNIYKKHEQCWNKYVSDESHLNAYADKYRAIINEQSAKFKLIELLSSGIMPPSDHKTLKKSWHSPSKLNKSVSKLLKKAQSQRRKVSFLNKNAQLIGDDHCSEMKNADSATDEKEMDDLYEYNTHLEIERMTEDKEDHIPLLYGMYKYSNTRNKLIKAEIGYSDQIGSVNHSMTQYEYVRKETMKAMRKMEIERLVHSKKVYDTLVAVFADDKHQITQKESFSSFVDSTQKLEPNNEFDRFLRASQQHEMRYVRPRSLVCSNLLISWRTPYHLLEDLMFVQPMNRSTLRVPFIFEYLMEHIEASDGVNDPDIFMVNPMSPKQSHIDHAFSFVSADGDQQRTMRTSDLLAIPVLTQQIHELYNCRHVPISDHHHAIILLKLWFHKSPEPIIPYYLYKMVCQFQSCDTVQQRSSFVAQILHQLSPVRLHCLARLVDICKKIVLQQHEITIIDLSYELSNVIIRNPCIKQWRHLDPLTNPNKDNVDDTHHLNVMLDPQSTYKLPLSPSHKEKRAQMAFITYILSNNVPQLSDKKVVNYGTKLAQYKLQNTQNDNQ
eukprot:139947_1